MFEKTVAMPVKYEMLSCAPWRQNLLVADNYGEGRVLLAGDAVHLVIPTGGLGMNSGVGDAVDLAWKLAATLQGWGGPNLLASYETERRQIGDPQRRSLAAGLARPARLAFGHGGRRCTTRRRKAQAARAKLVRIAEVEQRKSNEMIGAELGYRYRRLADHLRGAGRGPAGTTSCDYVPTTWPGARLPHVWLDDGRAMQDLLGDGYTLLRLGRSQANADALDQAFASHGAPFAVLDIADERPREIYGHDLLLVRPDLHVVWRGNTLPEPVRLAAVATGH